MALHLTYFVARGDQCTDETSNDHDLIDQDSVEDRGPWKTSCQEKIHEQEGGSDDPDVISMEPLQT